MIHTNQTSKVLLLNFFFAVLYGQLATRGAHLIKFSNRANIKQGILVKLLSSKGLLVNDYCEIDPRKTKKGSSCIISLCAVSSLVILFYATGPPTTETRQLVYT